MDKLAIYEHLDTMNECCHNKNNENFKPWTFNSRSSKNYCYRHTYTVETSYSYADTRNEDKLCDSCKYLLTKLPTLSSDK